MEDFRIDDLDVRDTEGRQIRQKPPGKRRIRKGRMMSVASIAACIVIFVAVIAAGVAVFVWMNKAREASNMDTKPIYTQAEMEAEAALLAEEMSKEATEQVLAQLAEELNSGKSVVEALRTLYTDKLVVASAGKYHFVPISDTLKKHEYRQENLQISESGELSYVEDGQVTSYKGIDISRYNGEVDWGKVAADGVEFAFIRVGIRGYGAEGKLVEDVGFEENVENALSNGIKVGVYFFSQATTVEEAIEEAEFVKQIIAPYKIECPVVFDVERISDSEARMNKISVEERTRMAITFCEEVEKAGYQPMIYYNLEMAATLLDLEQLEEYEKWFAYYNRDIYFPYDFKVWQYTDEGRVDGVTGEVDLNIAFEPLWN